MYSLYDLVSPSTLEQISVVVEEMPGGPFLKEISTFKGAMLSF